VATGRSSSSAQGQTASSGICGAGVGAAGNGYSAQPTQAGISGTSTPTGCSSAASGQNAGADQGLTAANAGDGTSTGGQTAASPWDTAPTEGSTRGPFSMLLAGSPDNGLLATLGTFGWWLLLLLVAFLLILFGAVIARRRKPAAQAA